MSTPWDEATIDTLLTCPPDALRWAAVAYRAGHVDGFRDGYRAADADMAAAWAAAARPIRRTLRQPTSAEMQHRRYGVADETLVAAPDVAALAGRQ